MADTRIEYSASNAISALGLYIKGKIPAVDASITQASNNAASSAAVFSYVAEKIAEIGSISFKMADSLPAAGDTKYIYLVPKTSAGSQNSFDEYIWYDAEWELIGSTDIDLSDYIKSSDMHEITAEEVNTIMGAVWGD